MSKGGSSSSQNSSTTVTTDKRLALESGIGISSDQSTVTVNNESVDAQIVHDALNAVAGSSAIAGDSFDKVLGLAGKLFDGGFKALGDSQQLTKDAYSAATNDKAGAIDNRTIAIVAVAGAAAWAYAGRKK